MAAGGAPQAVGVLERVEGGEAMLAEPRRRSGEGAAQTDVGRRLGGALAQRGADERDARSRRLAFEPRCQHLRDVAGLDRAALVRGASSAGA